MIDKIAFLNPHLLWPIGIGCCVLWILFIWKEYKQIPSLRFYLKILVGLITLIALGLMALKPVISKELKMSPSVLLTDDYSTAQLDSLKKVFKNLRTIPYHINKPIGSVLDSVSQVFVIGKGVQDFDFWQVKNTPTQYLSNPKLSGVTRLHYDQQINRGEDLIVKGRYENAKQGIRMVLVAPSGRSLDSINLGLKSDFKLTTQLKVKGNYVFELVERDSTGTRINAEPLPVSVLMKRPLKVFIVNGFPTFETKYLKNYLSEMGHELTVRSQLTRGKYKFEYFNTNRNPIYSFSKEQLEFLIW